MIMIERRILPQVDQGGGPGKRPTTAGKKIKTQANELVVIIIIILLISSTITAFVLMMLTTPVVE